MKYKNFHESGNRRLANSILRNGAECPPHWVKSDMVCKKAGHSENGFSVRYRKDNTCVYCRIDYGKRYAMRKFDNHDPKARQTIERLREEKALQEELSDEWSKYL